MTYNQFWVATNARHVTVMFWGNLELCTKLIICFGVFMAIGPLIPQFPRRVTPKNEIGLAHDVFSITFFCGKVEL